MNILVILAGAFVAAAVYEILSDGSKDSSNHGHTSLPPRNNGGDKNIINVDDKPEVTKEDGWMEGVNENGKPVCLHCDSSAEHGNKSKRIYRTEKEVLQAVRDLEKKGKFYDFYRCEIGKGYHLKSPSKH